MVGLGLLLDFRSRGFANNSISKFRNFVVSAHGDNGRKSVDIEISDFAPSFSRQDHSNNSLNFVL